MKATELRFFVGANLYSRTAVCRLSIAPESASEHLDAPAPTSLLHRCSSMFPQLAGLLHDATDPRQDGIRVVELLLNLIELFAAELGWRLAFRKIEKSPAHDGHDLVFSYEDREVAHATVTFALSVLQRLEAASQTEVDRLRLILKRELQNFVRQTAPRCRSVDTRYLVAAAEAKGIPVNLRDRDFAILGHGRRQQRVFRKTTPYTSFAAYKISSNKHVANREMARVGLPVPLQHVVSDRNAALGAAKKLGFPLVVKPAWTDMGVGISVDINDEDSLLAAFELALSHAPIVIIERFIAGQEYRLLVIAGELVAAAQRIPAHVVGDGRHSVAQLVDNLNRDLRRGVGKLSVVQ